MVTLSIFPSATAVDLLFIYCRTPDRSRRINPSFHTGQS